MMLCMAFTNRCSLSCATCLNDSEPKGHYGLPTETLIEVLGWLATQESPQVDFSGGEPLLRRDICKLIRFAQRNAIKVNVCTNGFQLDDELLDLLTDARRITMTFYGSETFHDSITHVPGSYQRALRTAARLSNTRARVRANVVTLAEALSDLPTLAFDLQSAGVSEIKFSLAFPLGRADNQTYHLMNRHENEQLSHTLAATKGLHVPVVVQTFRQENFTCEIPGRHSLFLTHDGRIYPCPFFRPVNLEIGRIHPGQSVDLVLKQLDWGKALDCHAQAGQNRCPAVAHGLFKHLSGIGIHQGCPPLVERT
jgi:MoaA/NifB/PqqE/SkfB family radical SAM enzyme